MLSARIAQSSRLVASTSAAPATGAFHSSAVAHAKVKSRQETNIKGRDERARKEALNRPHVVLGHRPGDEAKWRNCDLAKILVTEKDIEAAAPVPNTVPDGAEEVVVPQFLNYGLKDKERQKLFETLPVLTAEARVMRDLEQSHQLLPQEMITVAERAQKEGEAAQLYKAQLLARIVDLRNANARGIAYENRQRCIAEFSESGKLNDTGRPEVQAAILTMRIRNVWDHLMRSKKDIAGRRSLRSLVHQRAKILKYLKRLDQDRYEAVLERLGLEPAAVEGELVV
ncbi:uncharacterized protein PHACADRAFT_248398 [Phanerochaete carnosa HHB-10118-sp]|uniref:S15/NS1 RNA-binding domain-containing protein n=1 Tax=Phanerochaete carnosa (strain HHB-10118-sp) TaxID=650164 RepID=K5VF61_PHACS|nr:uncharacterized protein PHACADRAFT_248398 [Phanerochaete carnosa HHB-10118-sp]EKM61661.1 hypothetical protein PHACADRAFT_248398 [Phanerochaete carnosa HHB-10118-sp]